MSWCTGYILFIASGHVNRMCIVCSESREGGVMSGSLPPVLMGEARQQQQVVLCWDTRTTQPCTPLVTGVWVWGGGGGGGGV